MGLLRAGVRDVLNGGARDPGRLDADDAARQQRLPAERHPRAAQPPLQDHPGEARQRARGPPLEDWILTQYLNDVPYGTSTASNAIGVGAASQMFFDKPVAEARPRPDRAARRAAAGPVEYNPFNAPAARSSAPRAGAGGDGAVALHHARRRRTRPTHRRLQVVPQQHLRRRRAAVRLRLRPAAADRQARAGEPSTAGGLKVYTTINLAGSGLRSTALLENEGEPGDPAAALVSIDPYNGHILAMQNSTRTASTRARRQFDYAAQRERQTGSVVQGVRADDADPRRRRRPDPDLLRLALPLHRLAARVPDLLASRPPRTATRAHQRHGGDDPVRQHRVRAARRRPRDEQRRRDGARAGHHRTSVRLSGRGDRRARDRRLAAADGRRLRDSRQRRLHYPPTILAKVVLPSGKVVDLGNPTPASACSPRARTTRRPRS